MGDVTPIVTGCLAAPRAIDWSSGAARNASAVVALGASEISVKVGVSPHFSVLGFAHAG
jgi:hypothetical protein